MDETGIFTVPYKVPKKISSKGKKIVGKSVAAERGELVTAVCCFSASGIYVPPILVFPRKRMKEEYLNGAPPETLGLLFDSCCMTSFKILSCSALFVALTNMSSKYTTTFFM